MDHLTILLILAIAFGFFMAWGVGANDVANAMGASVGSHSITIKQAIIIAAIFEASGALLAGGQVTDTIRSNIINPIHLTGPPEVLIYGMLAALLAAGTWLLIATHYGWPVSTTHSIIGAIIGFGLLNLGAHAIQWGKVTEIALSWVVTPVLSGVLAYFIFRSIQRLIFVSFDPIKNAKKYLPFYVFFVAFIISMVTFTKGLKHVGIMLNTFENLFASMSIALLCTLISYYFLRRVRIDATVRRRERFRNVEKIFAILVVFTACAMAFAHGSNDVANAIGPLAAVVSLINDGAMAAQKTAIPIWVLFIGAAGIVMGLTMYGYKVIATIGTHITELTPSRAFAAEIATASTVVIASGTGMPISTTQTLVGAILGVGLARGIAALRLNVIRNIFMSWVITLPAGALLAALYFLILAWVFA